MTEILTESFCERCGTRYTFESARPRVRLKGVKVLSRGLKNFVLSDDTSIDEAMAAARSEADREASAHQLDAFHNTFNFCMSCRQYTCPNCWNESEARCLSCAPLALPEVPADIHDLPELRQAVLIGEAAPGNGTLAPEIEAAIADDVPVEEPTQAEVVAEADVPAVAAHEAPVHAAEGVAAEESIAAAADDSAAEGSAGNKAASQTLGLLQRFRPGQNLDAELAAYERERDDAAAALAVPAASEAADEPASEASAPTDDLAALQADRAATDAVAPVEREPAPASEPARVPEPEADVPVAPPIAAAAAADVVEQPTWRITAPDPTGATPATPQEDRGGSVPLQADAGAPRPSTGEPQWPARPEWPAASASAAGLPFLGRPATPQGGIDALWAASNQELVTATPPPGKAPATGIQPCISCGLSLSATARFCRRCGTLQGR